jgi:hypothetical protein
MNWFEDYFKMIAELYKKYPDVESDMERTFLEIKENREVIQRLENERIKIQNDSRILTCAFCGHEYPPNTPESNNVLLAEHILKCPNHPVGLRCKELEYEIEVLKKKLEEKELLISQPWKCEEYTRNKIANEIIEFEKSIKDIIDTLPPNWNIGQISYDYLELIVKDSKDFAHFVRHFDYKNFKLGEGSQNCLYLARYA